MKKLIALLIVSVFLVSFASAYICINPAEDSPEVQRFKSNINQEALKQDIEYGMSQQAVITKLKYFSPCKWQ